MRNVITSGLVTLAIALLVVTALGYPELSVMGGGADLSRCVSADATPIVPGVTLLTCVVDDQTGQVISRDELKARASTPVINSAGDSLSGSSDTLTADTALNTTYTWFGCLAGCGGVAFAQCVANLAPVMPISACVGVIVGEIPAVLMCAGMCNFIQRLNQDPGFTPSDAEF